MNLGCDKALYVLPFDHRQSYVMEMFHLEPPLTATQRDQVIDSKQLIYEGFRQALTEGVPFNAAGRQRGFVTAVSIERSGTDEFESEYGADFASHIEAFDPTFAKVLVRFNPEGDRALNLRQLGRLKQLSDYCRRSQRKFIFELLVPASHDQLAHSGGDNDTFDRQARPLLMQQTLHALQDAGIDPDVWKV